MSKGAAGVRYAELERETEQTRVQVLVDLDGGARQDVATGIGMFDRMLKLLAYEGVLNIGITAEGDLSVDDHHTVCDVGYLLGSAISQALFDTDPIEGAASAHTAAGDALVLVALDLNGTGQLFFDADFAGPRLGGMSTQSVGEFFRSMASKSGMTLHIRKVAGHNDHHLAEAIFRGVGRTLHDATRPSQRRNAPSSSR